MFESDNALVITFCDYFKHGKKAIDIMAFHKIYT